MKVGQRPETRGPPQSVLIVTSIEDSFFREHRKCDEEPDKRLLLRTSSFITSCAWSSVVKLTHPVLRRCLGMRSRLESGRTTAVSLRSLSSRIGGVHSGHRTRKRRPQHRKAPSLSGERDLNHSSLASSRIPVLRCLRLSAMP